MRLLPIVALTTIATLAAWAQGTPSTVEPETDSLGRSTPYGTVTGFLKAASAKDYALAAEYLDVRGSRSQEVAKELQTVLDWGLSGSLANVSRDPEGKTADGLPSARDRIGKVETAAGDLEIHLERIEPKNSPPIWLFASQTLRDLPEIYKEISERDLARYIPSGFRNIRFLGIPLWRWLGSTIGILIALISASLVTRLLLALVQPALRRYLHEDVNRERDALRWPVRIVLIAMAMKVFSLYSVTLLARSRWSTVSAALLAFGLAWLVMRFSDLVSEITERNLIWRGQRAKITMLNLVRRVFKILVVLTATLLLLQMGGVDVNKMLAGLGIGGIALALAAQKTLENVFGGVSLIMRDAVRVGDTCRIGGQIGVVEDIGMGTTRVRTLDRTIVTVPNAQLSTQNLENLTMRDKCWFSQNFGLRYDTTPQQMRAVLKRIGEILQGDARIEKQSARVRFIGFGESSFNIEIFAYILESDWAKFLAIQEEFLLKILAAIEQEGAMVSVPFVVKEGTGKAPPPGLQDNAPAQD